MQMIQGSSFFKSLGTSFHGDFKERENIYLFIYLYRLICSQVMRLCWAALPDDRPSFRTIKEQLTSIAQILQVDQQLPSDLAKLTNLAARDYVGLLTCYTCEMILSGPRRALTRMSQLRVARSDLAALRAPCNSKVNMVLSVTLTSQVMFCCILLALWGRDISFSESESNRGQCHIESTVPVTC